MLPLFASLQIRGMTVKITLYFLRSNAARSDTGAQSTSSELYRARNVKAKKRFFGKTFFERDNRAGISTRAPTTLSVHNFWAVLEGRGGEEGVSPVGEKFSGSSDRKRGWKRKGKKVASFVLFSFLGLDLPLFFFLLLTFPRPGPSNLPPAPLLSKLGLV